MTSFRQSFPWIACMKQTWWGDDYFKVCHTNNPSVYLYKNVPNTRNISVITFPCYIFTKSRKNMAEISSFVTPSRIKPKQYLYRPIRYQRQNKYYKCYLTNSVQTFWCVSEYISFRNGNYDLANYNQTFRRVWPNAREINVMRMASQTISAEIEPTDKLE